jgi:hypothetical protein
MDSKRTFLKGKQKKIDLTARDAIVISTNTRTTFEKNAPYVNTDYQHSMLLWLNYNVSDTRKMADVLAATLRLTYCIM